MADHIIHISNGKLANDTPFDHVETIVEAAVAKKNIVIHMHGGLVDEAAGRAIAEKLTSLYVDAGAYPIFPVWEAGLLEVLKNNMRELAGEAFFRVVLKRVLRIVGRKISQDDNTRAANSLPDIDFGAEESQLDAALDQVARGVEEAGQVRDAATLDPGTTQITPIEETALESELSSDFILQSTVESVSEGLRERSDIERDNAARSANPVIASTKTLMDPEAAEKLIDRPEGALQARGFISMAKVIKAIISIAKRVIERWLKGRFHGFHATTVEEILREFYLANIGGVFWSQMKKDTKDSFGSDPQVYGGTALLTLLNDRIGSANDVKITLIGHSTGAVFIAHLLEKAQEIRPSGFDFNIIMLAPASTCQLTTKAFHDFQNQIAGLRIFTMLDEKETADWLVPVLYPHSLLYFVSGVAEFEPDAPLVGLNRFYDRQKYPASKFPDVESFRQLIDNTQNGVVWSISTGQPDGLNCKAVHHGDFDDEDLTQKSMKHIIANGF